MNVSSLIESGLVVDTTNPHSNIAVNLRNPSTASTLRLSRFFNGWVRKAFVLWPSSVVITGEPLPKST